MTADGLRSHGRRHVATKVQQNQGKYNSTVRRGSARFEEVRRGSQWFTK
jgi:hypothetical protein